MRVRVAFGSWWEAPPGAAPTVVAAVDEYTEDEWGGLPDDYLKAVAEHRANSGDIREAFIDIPNDPIDALFATPAIPAKVEPL